MAGDRVKFGLTLPNRGVVIGATTVTEMLQLAADAESSGWDSVWVGDSIFARPQLGKKGCAGRVFSPRGGRHWGKTGSGRHRPLRIRFQLFEIADATLVPPVERPSSRV